MTTSNSNPQQRYVYIGYQGKDNPTERDRIVHLLDTYSTTEGFVAQYLPKWIDVSANETVKGGLRTVQAREAAHARLMKARLRELGESSKSKIPEERREKEIPFFSSPKHTDEEKLKVLADLFGDGEQFLKPVTELINQITDDLQTKELLRTILDDERESVNWIQGTYKTLSDKD
ncbi:MAG: hypothetical protein ACI9MF_001141 [Gammaproteobacteria bacterium]|jgi:hypothetical protein